MIGYKIFSFSPDYIDGDYIRAIDCFGVEFCVDAKDCLRYDNYTPTNTYLKVETDENCTPGKNGVAVCNKLKIIQILTYEEFGKLIV